MTPFIEGFVRARQLERALSRPEPGPESVAPVRGVRYRVGRRLIAIGAQMMGPEAPAAMPEWGHGRRAA